MWIGRLPYVAGARATAVNSSQRWMVSRRLGRRALCIDAHQAHTGVARIHTGLPRIWDPPTNVPRIQPRIQDGVQDGVQDGADGWHAIGCGGWIGWGGRRGVSFLIWGGAVQTVRATWAVASRRGPADGRRYPQASSQPGRRRGEHRARETYHIRERRVREADAGGWRGQRVPRFSSPGYRHRHQHRHRHWAWCGGRQRCGRQCRPSSCAGWRPRCDRTVAATLVGSDGGNVLQKQAISPRHQLLWAGLALKHALTVCTRPTP